MILNLTSNGLEVYTYHHVAVTHHLNALNHLLCLDCHILETGCIQPHQIQFPYLGVLTQSPPCIHMHPPPLSTILPLMSIHWGVSNFLAIILSCTKISSICLYILAKLRYVVQLQQSTVYFFPDLLQRRRQLLLIKFLQYFIPTQLRSSSDAK